MSDGFQSSWTRFAIEGVVIVVSILIAFGIDAFWQERQERLRTESHVKALQEEIGEAVIAVEVSQARREGRIAVIRELLASITEPETRDTRKSRSSVGSTLGRFKNR
jgi:hypothetical protein